MIIFFAKDQACHNQAALYFSIIVYTNDSVSLLLDISAGKRFVPFRIGAFSKVC